MKTAGKHEGKDAKADAKQKEKKDEAEEDHASHQHENTEWSRDVTIPPSYRKNMQLQDSDDETDPFHFLF